MSKQRSIQGVVLLSMLAGAALLGACKTGGGGVSTATGWNYNDAQYGGFEVVQDYKPITGPGLVFIEGGTFIMGRVEQDVMYDWNNTPRRITVSSFYMDEVETSNVVYREYLYWLGRVYGSSNKGLRSVYLQALPDTLVWREALGYNEPYTVDYLRHPAYVDYPVVGVSWRQAVDFAHWRSNRVNEKLLHDRGVINFDQDYVDAMMTTPEMVFDTDAYLLGRISLHEEKGLPSLDPNKPNGRNATIEDGILLPKYRLPTEAEWEFAATGLLGNTVNETLAQRKIYPWNGHNTRNSSLQDLGKMNANFVRGKGDYMGMAGDLNDKGDITVPVNSYWPNDYGLYCMAGNVNEWVLDVYRPLSHEDVNEFRPFRGNVFEKYKMDRSRPNEVAPLDSMGRVPKEPITAADAAGRYNYTQAYYINYRDGDRQSLISADSVHTDTRSTAEMYYQGRTTESNRPLEGMTTMITDQTRVYKGGGWRDRAYWLSPGARRYLAEDKAQVDLGFRLAMNAVGKPAAEDRE